LLDSISITGGYSAACIVIVKYNKVRLIGGMGTASPSVSQQVKLWQEKKAG